MFLSRHMRSLKVSQSLSVMTKRGVTSTTADVSRIHHGKVALVTGSSDTGGIGFAIARSLAKRGCSIILSGGRDYDKVESLRTELEGQYEISAHYTKVDLNVLDSIKSLHDDIKHIYAEGVDILVNNAGIASFHPMEEFPLESWERDIRINLTAPFYLTKLCLPDMKRKGWGRIINMSATTGSVGNAQCASVCSSKHGLNGLTKVVALETLGSGVTCNSLAPAFVNTEKIRQMFKTNAEELGLSSEDVKKLFEKFNPSGQLVELDQIAELSTFLCSPAADQITGSVHSIDAGSSAR